MINKSMSGVFKYLLFFIFLAEVANAQLLPGGNLEDNERREKKSDPNSSKFSVGLGSKASPMKSEYGIELGFDLGMYFNRSVKLAVDWYSLLSNNIYVIDNSKQAHLRLSYVSVTPTFYLDLIPGVYPYVTISGGLAYASFGLNPNVDIPADLDGEWFLLGEASLGLEVPLTSGISAGASIGWRLGTGPDIGDFTPEDFSSLIFRFNIIMVKF